MGKLLHSCILGSMLFLILAGLSSCRSSMPAKDYRALAKAAIRLGVDIGPEDNHKLYLEASRWIGVPYRRGGKSQSGTDCSGLAVNIYSRVYGVSLPRSSTEQIRKGTKVRKSKLKEGDLLFFSSRKSPKRVAHTGIYLKNGKFIHASSSKGVIVSSLNETYYQKHWMSARRIVH